MDSSFPSSRNARGRRRNHRGRAGASPDTKPDPPQSSRSPPSSESASYQQRGPQGNRSKPRLRPRADAWLARYPVDQMIIAKYENRPYLDSIPKEVDSPSLGLAGSFNSEEDAIQFFIAQDSQGLQGLPDQEQVVRVQNFCKGARTALGLFTEPSRPWGETTNIINTSTPKVWINDRDWSENRLGNNRPYERVLTTKRLDEVLHEKRLDNSESHVRDARRRLIFIGDGNGPSFYSLMSNAPFSQVKALGNLIGQHLLSKPVTAIDIGSSTWGQPVFDFNFNLAYFAICPADQIDNRSLRQSHDLPFLSINSHDRKDPGVTQSQAQAVMVLAEVVVSLCVTGLGESYWTGVCLKDEFHEGEPRLEWEEDLEDEEGHIDPILFEEASMSTSSPRTYYFQALAKFLVMVIKHYKHFGEIFGGSIPELNSDQPVSTQTLCLWMKDAPGTLHMVIGRVTELRDELQVMLKNAAIGPDGLPKSPFLQSLRNDPLARRSLGTILKVYEDLGRVDKQLQRYSNSVEQFKELLRTEKAKERNLAQTLSQTNERSVIKIAIFALAIATSALSVELYGILPEESRNHQGFFIFLALFIAFNIFAVTRVIGGQWFRRVGVLRLMRSQGGHAITTL